MNLIDKIFLDIREKYGSLAQPYFHFVQEAKLLAAYQDLLNNISKNSLLQKILIQTMT